MMAEESNFYYEVPQLLTEINRSLERIAAVIETDDRGDEEIPYEGKLSVGIQITRKDVQIIEVLCGPKDVSVDLEVFFDVAKRFCVEVNEDEWVEFYVDYNPESKYIDGMVKIHGPEDTDGFGYFPTIDEKKMFIEYIENYIKENYGKTASEYIKDAQTVSQ